jgi:hypothetical protein
MRRYSCYITSNFNLNDMALAGCTALHTVGLPGVVEP